MPKPKLPAAQARVARLLERHPEVRPMAVAEVAEACGVSKPNVKKMLRRAGVDPMEALAQGPVYARGVIEALAADRAADAEARDVDRRRRESAVGR